MTQTVYVVRDEMYPYYYTDDTGGLGDYMVELTEDEMHLVQEAERLLDAAQYMLADKYRAAAKVIAEVA